jgi:hypothetical protein
MPLPMTASYVFDSAYQKIVSPKNSQFRRTLNGVVGAHLRWLLKLTFQNRELAHGTVF